MREGLLSGSHEGAELLGSADGDHGNHSTARERRFRGKSPTIPGRLASHSAPPASNEKDRGL